MTREVKMFDLEKDAKGEVIDELLEMLKEKSKGKLFKAFGMPDDVKGKVNVSEKTYVIPFGKKKEDDEDNKESLADDVAHYEDIYHDNFDNIDGDDPYDEKFEVDKKEDEEEDKDKEEKLLALLKRM